MRRQVRSARCARCARWALVALGIALVGCGGGGDGETSTSDGDAAEKTVVITDADRADARKEFLDGCAPCHGKTGHGNGPASKNLNPKPRNYHDLKWQKSVSDKQIEKTILYGGAAVGKSAVMPSHPQFMADPVGLAALREFIRKFGDGKTEPPAVATTTTGSKAKNGGDSPN